MGRLRKSIIPASLVLVVVAGSLFPDVDVLWQHKSWTHDWRYPLAVLCIMAVAYLSGQFWTRVLRK